jgi:ATP synthase protein I
MNMKGKHISLGYRLVFVQFLVTLGIAGLLFLLMDSVTAYSALAGGMISTLSSAWFAARLFSDQTSWQPKQLASNVFKGEYGKLILTGALFVLAMVLIRPLNAVSFFITYLLVQFSPMIAVNRLKRN